MEEDNFWRDPVSGAYLDMTPQKQKDYFNVGTIYTNYPQTPTLQGGLSDDKYSKPKVDWGNIFTEVLDAINTGLQAYNTAQKAKSLPPRGMNQTVVHLGTNASSPIKLSPMGNPIPSFDPIESKPISSQIHGNALPQSNPLSKMRGNNLPKNITSNPNTNPGEVRSWMDHTPEELKALLQSGALVPLPNPTVPTAPLPSIWNMIPRASYGANASATSQGNNSSEQQQNQQAMLNELKGIHSALSQGMSGGGGTQRRNSDFSLSLFQSTAPKNAQFSKAKNDRENVEKVKMKKQEADIRQLVRNRLFSTPQSHEVEDYFVKQIIRKERELYSYIINKYHLFSASNSMIPNNRLNWDQLADITDYVAHQTNSDDEFSTQMWLLFGKGLHQPLNEYIHPGNIGLPFIFHNSTDYQEQFHHYLGAVTGDLYGSHYLNWPVAAEAYEASSMFAQDFRIDWGDVRLFYTAQNHRNDFILGGGKGRFTVAPNIRKMLALRSLK